MQLFVGIVRYRYCRVENVISLHRCCPINVFVLFDLIDFVGQYILLSLYIEM